MEKIEKLFFDPKVGFTSFEAFYQKVKDEGINVSKPLLKSWYESQEVNQLSKQVKPEYHKIISPYNSVGVVQIDLMDISKISRQNKGYKFILNCIDIYSRYVWSYPLKNKTASGIAEKLEIVFNEIIKKYPKNTLTLTSDQGTEFEGAVKTLSKKLNIERYYNDPSSVKQHTITAVVERYHRTLLNKIRKYASYTNTLSFIDQLDNFTDNYNNTIHSTIKAKPKDVFQGKIIYEQEKDNIKDLEIGSTVRTIIKGTKFDKKSLKNKWSEQLYTISRKDGNSYILKNKNGQEINKRYLKRELLVVTAIQGNEKNINVSNQIKEVEKKNRVIRRIGEDGFKPRDEVKEIKEDGTVIFKPRLSKAKPKRENKEVDRYVPKW